jgi:hypothetical protein
MGDRLGTGARGRPPIQPEQAPAEHHRQDEQLRTKLPRVLARNAKQDCDQQHGRGQAQRLCARLRKSGDAEMTSIAVLPVAAWAPRYEVTLSLVSVLGAGGVQQMHEPVMSSAERAALERSAGALREAAGRVLAALP